MPKTGFKTFVYSFSLSLFTILVVNGVFLRPTPSFSDTPAIPGKNVMLFINGNKANPSPRPVPVKKIALSKLPEIKPHDAAKPRQPDENTAAQDDTDLIIMADNLTDVIEIPLEISPFIDNQNSNAPQDIKTAALQQNEKPAPPGPKAGKRGLKKPQPSGAIKEEKTVHLETPVSRPTTAAVVYTPENQTDAPKPAKKFVIAEAGSPKPLLPLEKGYDERAGQNENIKISQGGSTNQVALADSTLPIQSMEKAVAAPAAMTEEQAVQWQKMSDKIKEQDSPWVVAKGAGKPANNLIMNEKYYAKDKQEIDLALNREKADGEKQKLQLASETVKNLLIPIPEDILNDDNLTPQLVSPPQSEEALKEKEIDLKIKAEQALKGNSPVKKAEKPLLVKKEESTAPIEISRPEPEKTALQDKKSNLLNSLTSIFNSETKVKQQDDDGSLLTDIRRKFKQAKSHGKIMPTEMRLSFQPNRAEISGQTLRWIQAFAAKAADNNNIGIEIRIDGTGALALQQKRLNLLHNILINKGVEYSKINTVFTHREANSFIIRTMKLNNFNNGSKTGFLNKASDGYYMQW